MTHVGKTVGKISIKSVIGSGGMGEVYQGFDEKLKRHVALKAIRGGGRFEQGARERLMREAEILSRLEHPNICRIYDYLEGDDCDFLVLELVEGESLSDAADRGLGFSSKLEIARQMALALSAAHRANITHRDLKPHNVMVTRQGDVKILDFGLAHSHGDPDETVAEALPTPAEAERHPSEWDTRPVSLATARVYGAFRTEYGMVTGTPMFMSPEQASGDPMTAASDMYSFGLVLQWLFTGKLPHPAGLAVPDLLRRARKGESLPVEGPPADLCLLINRLKSLAPELRPTAPEVLDRLKWIRAAPRRKRRRMELAAAAVLLVAASVVAVFDDIRARRSESRAIESEQAALRSQAEAAAVNGFLQDMLSSADPTEEGIHVKVVDVLDRAAEHVGRDFEDQPAAQASVLYTLGSTYLGLGVAEKAHAMLNRSVELRTDLFGPSDVRTFSARTRLARALLDLGKYDEAEKLLSGAIEEANSLLGEDRAEMIEAELAYADALQQQGRYQDSEQSFRRVWARSRAALGDRELHSLDAVTGLAWALQFQGKYVEAEAMHREAYDLKKEVLGAEHPSTLASMYGLAGSLQYQRKLDQAEALARELVTLTSRVFGESHSHTLSALDTLSTTLADEGNYEEAERLLRVSLTRIRETLGEQHPETLGVLNSLAWVLLAEDEYDQAAGMLERLVGSSRQVFGDEHPNTLAAVSNLASARLGQGRVAEAERLYRRNVPALSDAVGEDHILTLKARYGLAKTLERKGARAEAVAAYREAAEDGSDDAREALKRLGVRESD